MPAQQGVGGDQALVAALLWEEPGQGGEDGTVWPGGARSGDLPAQHRDFVPSHEQFSVLGGLLASEQCEPAKELTQDRVEESKCHGCSSFAGIC
jgi:hypothetical protein